MEEIIVRKYQALKDELNERQRRLWAASEALCLGRGGVTLVVRATGMSRTTITCGIKELENNKRIGENRVRREGGGRKKQPKNNRTCCLHLMPSSSRPPKVIPCRRFAGRRTVHVI